MYLLSIPMLDDIIKTTKDSIQQIIGNAITLIPALLTALIIIMLTRYGAEFVTKIVHRLSKKTIQNRSLQLLFIKVSHIATWVLGVIIACVIAFPGLSLGDIIATLGLSSVAIGFAFQDIFKNFLAGILILIQQPFCIDDQVIVDDYEGTVEKIDIRTTKIRTYQGERVLIPNSTIFTNAVIVRTAYDSRRTDLMVGVDYNSDLDKVVTLLNDIIANVEGVLHSPAPEIDIVNFGDSSIDCIVRYWSLPQQQKVRITQTKAILAIKKIFDQEDINIPYPIRTLYFYNQNSFDDYMTNPPVDSVNDNHERRQILSN